MNRYMMFNIDKFIKDSPIWGEEISDLKEQLEDATTLKAVNCDGQPRGGGISDSVSVAAEECVKISGEIDRIKLYQKAYNYAYSRLTPDKAELIEIFFFAKGMKAPLIDDYSRKYGYCIRAVYSLKREVVGEMEDYINEYVYGK